MYYQMPMPDSPPAAQYNLMLYEVVKLDEDPDFFG